MKLHEKMEYVIGQYDVILNKSSFYIYEDKFLEECPCNDIKIYLMG